MALRPEKIAVGVASIGLFAPRQAGGRACGALRSLKSRDEAAFARRMFPMFAVPRAWARGSPDRDSAGGDVREPVAGAVDLVILAMLHGLGGGLRVARPPLGPAFRLSIRREMLHAWLLLKGASHLLHPGGCRTAEFAD